MCFLVLSEAGTTPVAWSQFGLVSVGMRLRRLDSHCLTRVLNHGVKKRLSERAKSTTWRGGIFVRHANDSEGTPWHSGDEHPRLRRHARKQVLKGIKPRATRVDRCGRSQTRRSVSVPEDILYCRRLAECCRHWFVLRRPFDSSQLSSRRSRRFARLLYGNWNLFMARSARLALDRQAPSMSSPRARPATLSPRLRAPASEARGPSRRSASPSSFRG